MPRPTRLPTANSLPLRWTDDDARVVLDALDASGLSASDFSRRTGIQLQRIRRWRSVLGGPAPMRLVEVVPRVAPEAFRTVPAMEAPARETLAVTSPGGWVVRVPASLLGELVRALAEGGC